jgi:hypothetical protein
VLLKEVYWFVINPLHLYQTQRLKAQIELVKIPFNMPIGFLDRAKDQWLAHAIT